MDASLGLALFFAGGAVFFLAKSRWNYRRLPSLPEHANGSVSTVSVVIPARNEESTIARAVSSFKGVRVFVVDDESTDQTAARARQSGAKVIPAPSLPVDWLGKPHACRTGAQQVSTDWILFVDADTWFDPNFLRSAVAYAEDKGLEMVSVFPERVCHSFMERILIPYAFGLYFCGVSASSVNRHGKGESLANGQCILIRREAYIRIGGHAAVSSTIIEDVALAAAAKAAGIKLRVVRAEQMAHARMYENFRDMLRGFQKNSFRFLMANPVGGVQVIVASMLMLFYLPVLAYLAFMDQWLAFAGVALLPSALFAPWYGTILEAAAAPIAIYLFHLISMISMSGALFGGKTEWKGRHV